MLQTLFFTIRTLTDTYTFLRRSLDHTGQTLDMHPMTHSYSDSFPFRYISPDS